MLLAKVALASPAVSLPDALLLPAVIVMLDALTLLPNKEVWRGAGIGAETDRADRLRPGKIARRVDLLHPAPAGPEITQRRRPLGGARIIRDNLLANGSGTECKG